MNVKIINIYYYWYKKKMKWIKLHIIRDFVVLYFSLRILNIKFKSLLNIFFLFILIILIDKNSYTTNATVHIIVLGWILSIDWLNKTNNDEIIKPKPKLPESL